MPVFPFGCFYSVKKQGISHPALILSRASTTFLLFPPVSHQLFLTLRCSAYPHMHPPLGFTIGKLPFGKKGALFSVFSLKIHAHKQRAANTELQPQLKARPPTPAAAGPVPACKPGPKEINAWRKFLSNFHAQICCGSWAQIEHRPS